MNSTLQLSVSMTIATILVDAITEVTPKKVFSQMSLVNKAITCLIGLNAVLVAVGPVLTPKTPTINQVYFAVSTTYAPDSSKYHLVEEQCKTKFADAKFENDGATLLCYR